MDKAFNSKSYSKEFDFSKIDLERIKILVDMVGENKKVLDIGCGDGFTSNLIKKQNNQVVGIEISDEMRKLAEEKGFKVYDLDLGSNWSGKISEKFNVVFAGKIIEHIFDTDKFLQNVGEVLKKDGKLVLSTPNIASLPRRILLLLGRSSYIETTSRKYDAGHIRYFTFKTLTKLLKENNFEIIEYKSDGVNISPSGNLFLKFLVNIFPTLGRSLIVKARYAK